MQYAKRFFKLRNYGSYDRLTQDGLTQWHPAFLRLGTTLEACSAIYRNFCRKYRPAPKPERRNHWGSRLLKNLKLSKLGAASHRDAIRDGNLCLSQLF